MDRLEMRPYGSTGEQVTIVGLGGASLDKHSLADGQATVLRALELGINYIDTSPGYGHGASQVILGTALQGRSEDYLLATKLGYLKTPLHYRSLDALRAQLAENLRALRRDSVDILQVHMAEWTCWWRDGVASEGELIRPDEVCSFSDAPVMRVLREAKELGLCRYIGVTADRAAELGHVLRHVEVDCCLPAYGCTALCRRAREGVMPLARERQIAYIAAGVLRPLGVADGCTRDSHLEEIRRESGLSLVEISIRYLLADPNIATILVGAATPAEIEECVVSAQKGPLPPDLHMAVERLATE